MPNFARAEIFNTTDDLSDYKNFLKKLNVGQVVTLPLETGETSRKVMRALNAAASESGMRLARLPSPAESVRFRIVPTEKRRVSLSEEARRRRADRARATRAARAGAEQAAPAGAPVPRRTTSRNGRRATG